MNVLSDHTNEFKASEAFSKQSPVFDQLYNDDPIIRYKRQRVREHILQQLRAGSTMLELNCGSGEDALFFAQKGYTVHATDISAGMLGVFRNKIQNTSYQDKITIEQCSFTALEFLQERKTFDYIYSNCGGLNCTGKLGKVLHSLYALLNPGGTVTLVIISRFCLWETLLAFKGKFKTAFRRFFAAKGRRAYVEGTFFKCWYYSPSFVKKHLQNKFEITSVEGLCILVPPSYIEKFATKHPHLFSFLKRKEDQLKARWPWNRIGDYFIISLRKK